MLNAFVRACQHVAFVRPEFDRAVMLVIVANCIVMMLDNPLEPEGTQLKRAISAMEVIFTVLFAIEFIVKICALGVWHTNKGKDDKEEQLGIERNDLDKGRGYFQNAWNRLDFVILVESVVSNTVSGSVNISGIRTLRVLRPLRTINKLPGLKLLITSVMDAIPMLLNTLFGFLIYFLIFDILGTQLWNGKFRMRCHFDKSGNGTAFELNTDDQRLCGAAGSSAMHHCASGQFCREFQNPDHGITNFDHVLWASLNVFQCITLEGWTEIMYYTQDSSDSIFPCIYFIVMIIFGAFILLNLILAVIVNRFNEATETYAKEVRMKKMRKYVNFLGNRLENIETRRAFDAWRINSGFVRKYIQPSAAHVTVLATARRASVQFVETVSHSVCDCFCGISKVARVVPTNADGESPVVATKTPAWAKIIRSVIRQCNLMSQDTHIFSKMMSLCIVLNTVVLAMDRHNIDDTTYQVLLTANFIFTFVFLVEMIVKVLGLGVLGYCGDRFNIFDGTIVVVSLLEVILGSTGTSGAFRAVRIFRLLRVLRVAKLARHLKFLTHLIEVIAGSLDSIGFASLLLGLFIVIYSILGVQLFAGKFKFDDGLARTYFAGKYVSQINERDILPRHNYDSILWAIITTFQMLTAENWNKIMHDGMVATNSAAALYFISWMVIGRFILLSVFLAVLLKKSEDDQVVERIRPNRRGTGFAVDHYPSHIKVSRRVMSKLKRRAAHIADGMVRTARRLSMLGHGPKTHAADEEDANLDDGAVVAASTENIELLTFDVSNSAVLDGVTLAIDDRVLLVHQNTKTENGIWVIGQSAAPARPDDYAAGADPSTTRCLVERGNTHSKRSFVCTAREGSEINIDDVDFVDAPMPLARPQPKPRPTHQGRGRPRSNSVTDKMLERIRRGSTSVTTPLSRRCYSVVSNRWFDHSILFLIIVSSLTLALEDPKTQGNEQTMAILNSLEIFFTAVFTMEVVFKVGAFGWLTYPMGYLRNSWNLLDLVVVVSSILSLALSNIEVLGSFRTLRLIRCLRPLRVISRNPGMKLVVNALILSVWPMLNVIAVLSLVWLMFAIVGVTLFGGQFYRCNDPSFPQGALLTGEMGSYNTWTVMPCNSSYTYTDADGTHQRLVLNANSNFDNVFQAMMALFIMSSLEGWPELMYDACDAAGVGRQPRLNNNEHAAWFFVCFMVLGSFFFLNLFVLTIFQNFNAIKQDMEGFSLLTPEQQKWIAMQKRIGKSDAVVRTIRPEHPVRGWCWSIVKKPWFDILIMVLIALNIMLMATTHYGQSEDFEKFLDISNAVFVVVFFLEAVVKISGLTWRTYWIDNWNKFDFVLVIISNIDFILSVSNVENIPMGPSLLRILRLTRLARILRVAKNAEGLRRTFLTIYLSLPSLVNVGSLLLLVFFIFGVLGIFLFGGEFNQESRVWSNPQNGEYINEHANFRNMPMALMTLFRCCTGEDWNDIMYAMHNQTR
jgi:voltage-gated sodium channel type XI alpha